MKYIISLAAMAALLAGASASSHGEAPGVLKRPQTDPTDVYAFRSYEPGRENWVTLLTNYLPLQDGFAGPNYFSLSDQHWYEIYVDNDGDGVEDITFQFRMETELPGRGVALRVGGVDVPIALKTIGPITRDSQANLNWLEFYRLNVIYGRRENGERLAVTSTEGDSLFTKPFDNAGAKTFPEGYEDYASQFITDIDIPRCSTPGKVFVGQRSEAFFIKLGPVFDLINFVPIDSTVFPGGISQSTTNNQIAAKNIATFALEVPISCLTGSGNGVIGVWTGTRAVASGKQQNRLGNPLVNELLIGLRDKNRWNRQRPSADSNFLIYITNPTFPAIIDVLFRDAVNSVLGTDFDNIAPSNIPRNDLVAILLTGLPGVNQLTRSDVLADMVRLNTAIPVTAREAQNSLGVVAGDNAGFPNGRRPGDDSVDIVLRAAMGIACHLNLGVCTPDQAPVGNAPITDGAPISALDFGTAFPYLNSPTGGSPFP